MHRTVIASIVVAALTGCGAKTVATSISVMGDSVQVEPTTVEFQHETDGWIKVSLGASADQLGQLEAGEAVELTTADLPKGMYQGARLMTGVVHAMEAAPAEEMAEDSEKKMITRGEGEDAEDGEKKTITRAEDAPEDTEKKTITRAEGEEEMAEDGEKKTISRGAAEGEAAEPTRTDEEISSKKEFCLSDDGGVTLTVTKKDDGSLKLKVNAPDC